MLCVHSWDLYGGRVVVVVVVDFIHTHTLVLWGRRTNNTHKYEWLDG